MATKRTLILQANDPSTDELVQKSYTSANPSATAANINTFMRAVNSLSNNTYRDTLIVDTRSVNEELNA